MSIDINITTDINALLFEIDGKMEYFDAFYDNSGFPKCAALCGSNEGTQNSDAVRGFYPTGTVFSLAAYRKNKDGSTFGIQGLFKDHLWCAGEDDKPLLKLWNRII